MDAAAGAPIPAPSDAGQGTAAAFPIAIVIAIGFMVTTLILISYYFLVVRCWLRGGGASGLLHRARREDDRGGLAERVSAVFFADHDAAELPGGLDPDVVAALPVVRYYRRRARSASECAVCLGEFAPGERLKLLPGCSHAFHIDCIDTWLHHNVSCPLCRAVVTAVGVGPLARDDHDASCRDLLQLGGGDARRVVDAAARVGYGSSCRFPTKAAPAVAQEPIARSFSMDCFAGGLGRKPQEKEPAAGSCGEAGPSLAVAAAGGSSDVADRGAGETSGRFRRLLSSFGLGRSSRSTVLPIHLDNP